MRLDEEQTEIDIKEMGVSDGERIILYCLDHVYVLPSALLWIQK